MSSICWLLGFPLHLLQCSEISEETDYLQFRVQFRLPLRNMLFWSLHPLPRASWRSLFKTTEKGWLDEAPVNQYSSIPLEIFFSLFLFIPPVMFSYTFGFWDTQPPVYWPSRQWGHGYLLWNDPQVTPNIGWHSHMLCTTIAPNILQEEQFVDSGFCDWTGVQISIFLACVVPSDAKKI